MTHLVQFVGFSVFGQKSSEDTHATNPDEFDWHTSVGSTLSFTGTGVTTLSAGFSVQSCAGTGVNGDWLADDQTVLDQTSNLMSKNKLLIDLSLV